MFATRDTNRTQCQENNKTDSPLTSIWKNRHKGWVGIMKYNFFSSLKSLNNETDREQSTILNSNVGVANAVFSWEIWGEI